MKNERLTTAQIQTLTPLLEERQARLRQILADVGDGKRGWDVDVDLAVNDVLSVLNTLVPPVTENEDK